MQNTLEKASFFYFCQKIIAVKLLVSYSLRFIKTNKYYAATTAILLSITPTPAQKINTTELEGMTGYDEQAIE